MGVGILKQRQGDSELNLNITLQHSFTTLFTRRLSCVRPWIQNSNIEITIRRNGLVEYFQHVHCQLFHN